jgi:hypothetical protein
VGDIRVTYFRYHTEYTDGFDTVDEAVGFLVWGEESESLTSRGARIFDGERVVLEGDSLARRVDDAWAKLT